MTTADNSYVSTTTTTTKEGTTVSTTKNHGRVRASGTTTEMTTAEYRQAVTVKYARLPIIGGSAAVDMLDLAMARADNLAAAVTRGQQYRRHASTF